MSYIYAEVSVGFARIEEVEAALPADTFRRLPIPWEAAFLVGKAFVDYRRCTRAGSGFVPVNARYAAVPALFSASTAHCTCAGRGEGIE